MKLTDVLNASKEFLGQGHQFKQSGKLDQAIISFQRAIELNGYCDEAYHFLGEILGQKNELVEATRYYVQALEINPQNHWTHHCLGQTFSWLDNIDDAVDCAVRALELQPDLPEFSVQLALYLEIKGDTTEAIAHYQKALQLNPDLSESTYLSLIKLMGEQDQTRAAIPYCQAGVQIHPNCAELQFLMGQTFARENLLPDAIDSYKQAVALQPNYWQADEALSLIYTQLEQTNLAAEAKAQAEKAFFQIPEFNRSDLPADFDWEIYLAFNSELQVNSPLEAIAHFLLYGIKENKLYALKHLHDPAKKPDIVPSTKISTDNPNLQTSSISTNRLAILVHIYYFDLWSELASYITNIPKGFDLYINIVVSIWQPQMHDIIRQDFSQAKIIISTNRGKDIGGHLSSMRHLDFSRYDLMCLLHTKKSPHIDSRISDAWRRDLYQSLLGNPAKAAENIALMHQHKQIGSIGSRFWRCTMMGNNWSNYNRLLAEFNISKTAQDCEYVSGTMMFVRSQIMETIYNHFQDQELESGDQQSLDFHVDGQVAHAIERLIGNLVRDRGLTMYWQE